MPCQAGRRRKITDLVQVASEMEAVARLIGRQLDRAAAMVDERLAENPGDVEARAWRARLLAWRGRWAEAESEYRRVLELAKAHQPAIDDLAREQRDDAHPREHVDALRLRRDAAHRAARESCAAGRALHPADALQDGPDPVHARFDCNSDAIPGRALRLRYKATS